MKKAVFLDRDGTIIKDKVYLDNPDDIEVFKEAYPALQLLHRRGFLIFIATNQSGVARGLVKEENIKKIHAQILADFSNQEASITEAYYCPHPIDGGCDCRKPNPGMLARAARDHGVDLKQSWMVGDRMTDVEAGRRAGAKSILLQNETTPPRDETYIEPEFVCTNILEAAQLIIQN